MNVNPKKLKYLIFVLCLIVFQVAVVSAQNTPPPQTPPVKPVPNIKRTPGVRVFPPRQPRNMPMEFDTSERSLAVDAKVNINLCVIEGHVKINGWDRNEVRVFVKEGSRIGFNILQKNRQTSNPVWIMLLGFDPTAPNQPPGKPSECLYGEEIEIDVPRNASINVKGQETITTIDSVRKASVKNIGGDISLRNIAEGADASTYEGDVTVEDSNGSMTLESATGNILAFEVSPSEIGDIFRAKTNNGTIALQGLEHRQIEVNSISGSIAYNGNFSNGGVYNFGTSNGTITLAIPPDSSCKINASYGYGYFNSEIPLTNIVKNSPQGSRLQNLTALIGSGDSTLKLTTNSGAIRIRNKNQTP
jgi:hypothetical protein